MGGHILICLNKSIKTIVSNYFWLGNLGFALLIVVFKISCKGIDVIKKMHKNLLDIQTHGMIRSIILHSKVIIVIPQNKPMTIEYFQNLPF